MVLHHQRRKVFKSLAPLLFLISILLNIVSIAESGTKNNNDNNDNEWHSRRRWQFPRGRALTSTLHAARILQEESCEWGGEPPYPPAVNVTLELPVHGGSDGERALT